MYRELLKKTNYTVYCENWPCDRECGKFHRRFLATTKLRNRSNETEQEENKQNTEKSSIFEEIMMMAAKKDSQAFESILPPFPEGLDDVRGVKRVAHQKSSEIDTTMIYFDNPVWDDAKFRDELFDYDDDYVLADPPSNLTDDDDQIESILKNTKNDKFSNPVAHFRKDETILDSDEDYDYSNVDLTRKLNNPTDKLYYNYPEILIEKPPEYEKNL